MEHYDDVVVYIVCGLAGGMAGLSRFLASPRRWGWRTISSFVLFGMIAAVAVVGLWFGSDVVGANRWKALAISLAVGYVQEEAARLLQMVARQYTGGGNGTGESKGP